MRDFAIPRESLRQIVEENVDDGRGIEREYLAYKESTNHGDAERTAQLGTDAVAKREWQTAQQRGHSRHHDWSETQQAGFVDGIGRAFAVMALGIEREVHHHDAIFFDDANQQHQADDGNYAEVQSKKNKREKCANASGGKGRKNGNR